MSIINVRVAFTPADAAPVPLDICIVVDVLRATSSLVTMFARGLEEAFVASSIDAARRLAREHSGLLVCGEEGGLAPEGFDYGNSPSAFAELDLRGRRAVLATTNGTKALAAARARSDVIVGSLLNASAVAEELQRAGARDVLIVCAGEGGGKLACMEDVYCAGAIVDLLAVDTDARLADDALIARKLYASFDGPAEEALLATKHGSALDGLGFAADVRFCARRDVFSVVPRLDVAGDGLLRVRAGSRCA